MHKDDTMTCKIDTYKKFTFITRIHCKHQDNYFHFECTWKHYESNRIFTTKKFKFMMWCQVQQFICIMISQLFFSILLRIFCKNMGKVSELISHFNYKLMIVNNTCWTIDISLTLVMVCPIMFELLRLNEFIMMYNMSHARNQMTFKIERV